MKPTFASASIYLTLIALIGSHGIAAKTLDVAVGWTKPPYVIADGNTGFELDLVRAVFDKIGHEIVPIYVPYGRSHAMLKNGVVDLTLTLNDKHNIDANTLSDVYVTYQNVAISLKSAELQLNAISDLQYHTVVAFQNASIVLGQEFSDSIKQSRLYIELPDQKKQVEMLLLGNTALIVMDINIFKHISKELRGVDQTHVVDFHFLFPANPYRAGFKDLDLKNAFNLALSDFIQSDQYEWLKYRYGLN